MILLIVAYPSFFIYIENRQGWLLQDYFLNRIEPADVSHVIFSIIWGTVLLVVLLAIYDPIFFLKVLSAYTMLSLLRILLLYLVPLEAPLHLIALKDPLTNYFYGQTFITKDLFFSGHTATLCIFAFTIENQWLKTLFVLLTLVLAFLLLVQHVHYTIDVFAALPFAYLACYLSTRVLEAVQTKVEKG